MPRRPVFDQAESSSPLMLVRSPDRIMPIKVAIVEDDSGVRQSLEALISGTPGFQCTGSYPNAEAALRRTPHDWPDVILMDISLPGDSGITCVAQIKALRPKVQVIMFTV